MKKIICLLVLISFCCVACGHNLYINGEVKRTIGLANLIIDNPNIMEAKDPNIQYKIIWGNVIWGSLLFSTVIAPVYFFGFSMFEPVGYLKEEPHV